MEVNKHSNKFYNAFCVWVKEADNGKAVVFLVLCLLLAVRLTAFGTIPGGLNQDGAMAAVDAKALAEYGTDRFGTFMPAHLRAWGYGQMSALLSYLMVPFVKIFGLNRTAVRLPILIASVLGSIAVYGTVKKVSDVKTGLAALLILAVNPWHFMQSRWALDCNLFPHMFVLGLFFLISSLKPDSASGKSREAGSAADMASGRKGKLYLSMVFFALCMYCYGVAFYMVPFFLLISCALLLLQKQVKWKEILICLFVYFGISWPVYGTMLINFMKWETVSLPFVTMEFFEGSVRSADILFFSENIGEQLLGNAKSLLNVVFLQKEDLLWNSIRDFGPMYRGTLPFVVLGAVLTARGAVKEENRARKTGCQLLFIFWICSLFTGLVINDININRINIIFYIHIIFAAAGVSFIIKKWKMAVYVFLTVFSFQSGMFFHAYFTDWSGEIERAFYGDFLDALEYAKDCDRGQYFITPDTQYEGAWNVTEILTLFVFEVDARYYQGADGSGQEGELPYREKFLYSNPPGGEALPEAVYVFKSPDMDKFAGGNFNLTFFGDYSVAVPVTEPESSP